MPDTLMHTSPNPAATGHKLSLVALALALIALSVALFRIAAGSAVLWTAVALPLLVAANSTVMALRVGTKYPRAVKTYWVFSCGAALLLLVYLLARLAR